MEKIVILDDMIITKLNINLCKEKAFASLVLECDPKQATCPVILEFKFMDFKFWKHSNFKRKRFYQYVVSRVFR